ncbi:4Fe-4S dicluster domain-containing protein [bacterium]|nr:4Fe-4S dicluster domain-containing protein [bacterium]MBU1073872.1 4Fe-4S dicluster domain-containing protein [bacterium]MBU1675107.1 4Fe-4S dicluster domain-containing protein [bacterium]
MDKGRRDFLKISGASLLGLGVGGPVVASGPEKRARDAHAGPRWAMVIDTTKCRRRDGCSACSDACHLVHNVPEIPEPRHEVKWIWKEKYPRAFPTQVHPYTEKSVLEQSVPVLCNHCDRPPCVRVCPTQATFKAEDGIVAMDMHRCIGCRYCIAACPYGSRSFNWRDPRPYIEDVQPDYPTRTKGVVEKCNFCKERLARGRIPACVEACAAAGNEGVLLFGDLNDPESDVSRALRTANTIRRKPSLGTAPHIFYIV